MALHLSVDGIEYVTMEPGELPGVGMFVGTPDGRIAEVTAAAADGWLRARPWDHTADRDYRVTDVYAWIEA